MPACGPPLDPAVFEAASVPAETRAVTERLREAGAKAPALTVARIPDLRHPPPGHGGALREEPPSELATERVIDAPGGPLRLRVLAPPGEIRACYLHLHGGGWTIGAADHQDRTLLGFAAAARVAVVALEYRLAPEHPHPAALEDCVAAVGWLAEHGPRELGSGRLIVGGESAGAHIGALALVTLRDREELAAVSGANLAYGPYDVSMTPSARRWGAERIVIGTPDLAFYAAQYAPAERHRDPDVSPLYADLRGLPPALFSCGTLDPLLDDTLFMAARWQAAGNEARLALYPGAPHEFLNLRDRISAEQEARDRMVAFIDACLSED